MLIKRHKILLGTAAGIVLILALIVIAGNMIENSWARGKAEATGAAEKPEKGAKTLQTKAKQLAAKMKNLMPRGTYVLIDTAENRLRVMRDGKMVQEAVVSCGSGDILQDPSGERKWIFDTPRGEFFVSSKLVNPTWIKPDWAFYEEGEELPANFNDRIDNDTLGEYALGFGSGYFIHGTLYTRMLGRNVTHGCVRVGDDDLKKIYRTVPMGARVYIY
ncbi:MAG: L,D-transpeptidase [Candidatus Aminicenantes bacterium]|nr:L,D-transpeptidase [Candidatus Aminicenantes bacterium]